ncbi:sigma-70 family RNA polymerase sigma factor [Sphingobacterium sp. lm-10]|uniref:sigma-70 family RNA polymerase sigma factor n=1 Tax=Sphingobacterium sp. lm-10 TaxID=2944904 RepID=UPI00202058A7|nr:sigma-70 family RNA polymerase sigma factor [Sphingobacterium sp. lm-10]MCL7987870.1 sigma-70 family RNA polymerase sigma factor [Sphingobacterium sp. lm-10]
MQTCDLTNQTLLSLLKKSDHGAFEEIYRRYWRSLFRQLHAKSGNMELAEELTQKIFVSLWERRAELNIQHLPSYLDAAARFSFINHIKSVIKAERFAHFKKSEDDPQQQNNCIDPLSAKELMGQLYDGLKQLPPKTRQIFVMSRIEYQSVKKIAHALQLSEKAVEYHITKSLKALRIVLRDYLTIGALTIWISAPYLFS